MNHCEKLQRKIESTNIPITEKTQIKILFNSFLMFNPALGYNHIIYTANFNTKKTSKNIDRILLKDLLNLKQFKIVKLKRIREYFI